MLLLTYKILKPKARHKIGVAGVKSFNEEEKKLVLRANLIKNFFNVGDKVKFKKPRRNPLTGVVVAIQSEMSEVTWVNGGTTPMNIVVEVARNSGTTERVKTNVKKLLYLGGV